jgi:hypothetical protein
MTSKFTEKAGSEKPDVDLASPDGKSTPQEVQIASLLVSLATMDSAHLEQFGKLDTSPPSPEALYFAQLLNQSNRSTEEREAESSGELKTVLHRD